MSGLSFYAQKLYGDPILVAARWMSLHIADPTDLGSMINEVPTSGTNYARCDMSGKMSAFDITTGRASLVTAVNIGPATLDWGLIVFAGFWNDPSAGQMIASCQLLTAQDVGIGKQFQLLPGQFNVGKNP